MVIILQCQVGNIPHLSFEWNKKQGNPFISAILLDKSQSFDNNCNPTHLFEREDEDLVISEEQPGWRKEKY